VVRHVVLFRFDPSVDEADRRKAAEALRAMAPGIPSVRQLAVGANVGRTPPNYDLGIEVLFDDQDGFAAYAASEPHRHAWEDVVRPLVAEVAAIQFEVEDPYESRA
jgi:hypothetical protein